MLPPSAWVLCSFFCVSARLARVLIARGALRAPATPRWIDWIPLSIDWIMYSCIRPADFDFTTLGPSDRSRAVLRKVVGSIPARDFCHFPRFLAASAGACGPPEAFAMRLGAALELDSGIRLYTASQCWRESDI